MYCIQIKDIIPLKTDFDEGNKQNTEINTHSNGSDPTNKGDTGDSSSNKSGQENNKNNKNNGANRGYIPTENTQKYRVNKLSRLSRNERRLISEVYKIIKENSTEEVAEKIMTAIEDKFR